MLLCHQWVINGGHLQQHDPTGPVTSVAIHSDKCVDRTRSSGETQTDGSGTAHPSTKFGVAMRLHGRNEVSSRLDRRHGSDPARRLTGVEVTTSNADRASAGIDGEATRSWPLPRIYDGIDSHTDLLPHNPPPPPPKTPLVQR
jgi:hypothetical protein